MFDHRSIQVGVRTLTLRSDAVHAVERKGASGRDEPSLCVSLGYLSGLYVCRYGVYVYCAALCPAGGGFFYFLLFSV